jgi:hypothetical protein
VRPLLSVAPSTKSPRTPRPRRPITLAHCHVPVPAAALVSSSSRDSRPAVSPSTDPVRPHRPAGSTHHDAANTTQPTQHSPCVLPAPSRPRWSLPKCWKSAPIIHARLATETRLSACDRPKLSSCRSSSMVLAPTCTTSRAVNRHQIPIEPAAAACSPIRDFVHCRFADAGRRWVWSRFPRPASANLYIKRPSWRPDKGEFLAALLDEAATDGRPA